MYFTSTMLRSVRPASRNQCSQLFSCVFAWHLLQDSKFDEDCGMLLPHLFPNLDALEIFNCLTRELPISQLSGLQQLRSLTLIRCTPVGVLQSVSLQELGLWGVKVPPGTQFNCTMLRTLIMDRNRLSLSLISALPLLGLPNLRPMEVVILDVSDAADVDLQGISQRLAWLPLTIDDQGDSCEFLLIGHRGWSHSESLLVLQALADSDAEIFLKDLDLILEHWSIGFGFMQVLTAMFPNTSKVQIETTCTYIDTDTGLFHAVTMMDSLHILTVSLIGTEHVPRDCLMALLTAQQDRGRRSRNRPFKLYLDIDPPMQPMVDILCNQFRTYMMGQEDPDFVLFEYLVHDEPQPEGVNVEGGDSI